MLILERPTTLRDTLQLKYNVVAVYRKILNFADLPYFFDQINRKWWRYFSDVYGFYYSRNHRSYTIWLSNGLKKNIGLYMPFLMRMPVKKFKSIDPWKRRSYLYKNTMLNNYDNHWVNPRFFKKLNFNKFNFFTTTKATIYSNFIGNVEHYAISSYGLFGLDENNLYSGYNAKWHDIYKYWASFYKLSGLAPSSFFIGVNNFYIWSSFFINLFDTTVILYPEHFLIYYNNIFIKNITMVVSPFITSIINLWVVNFNYLYGNLLCLLYKIFIKFYYYKFNKYFNIRFYSTNDNSLLIYKINLFYICVNYFVYKTIISHSKLYVSSFLYFFNNIKNIKILEDIYLLYNSKHKVLKNNNYFLNNFISSKKYIIDNVYDKKIWLLNNFKLLNYIRNHKILNKGNNSNKHSSFFIKLYRITWSFNFYVKIKNKIIIKDLLKFFIKNTYSNKYSGTRFSLLKFSLLKYNKLNFLNIKRILTYGKLFFKVPSLLLKHKLGYNKANSLIANKSLFRTFLFMFYKKNIYTKIAKINLNLFNTIYIIIKFNFGNSLHLVSHTKGKSYLKFLDKQYFYNIEYLLYKYLKFFNVYLLKNSNNLNNNLFNSVNYYYYKICIFIFYNVFINKYKFNILFKNKLKYYNYCYKGLNLKLLKY